VDAQKNAHSNMAYLTVSQVFSRRHSGYISYRFNDHDAEGPDYSYRSSSFRLGWIARWWKPFKTTGTLGCLDRSYNNVDDRFLVQRHDTTYSFSFKPSYTIVPGLDAVASWNYQYNHSNVDIKRYYDQIYRIGLEGHF
jgi:hypothetical protein